MEIFYINLDRETDRRDSMESQLAAAGLAAERLSATTADDLPAELVQRVCNPGSPPWITPLELACTTSHRTAWTLVRDRDLPMALILEDDVHLSPRLSQLLAAIAPFCAGLDLVRIETEMVPLKLGPATAAGAFALRALHSVVWGARGYVVTREGAERLLSMDLPLHVPLDHLLFDYHVGSARRLRTRQLVPAGVAGGDIAASRYGTAFASALEPARRARIDVDPGALKAAALRLALPASQRWLGFRDGVRDAVNGAFRGIHVMDVPLF